MSSAKDKLIWLLIALLGLVPLPLASNRAWSWSLLVAVIGLLLIFWGIAVASGRLQHEIGLRRYAAWVVGYLAAVGWISAQCILQDQVPWQHEVWAEAGIALVESLPGRLHVDPTVCPKRLMLLLAYGGVFLLALQLSRNPVRATRLLAAYSTIAVIYALVGMLDRFADIHPIPWMPDNADLVRGPFPNRNHFATFAGMALLVAVGLLLRGSTFDRHDPEADPMTAKAWNRTILLDRWFNLFSVAVLSMAVLLSGSRAGMFSTVLGLLVLVCAILFRSHQTRAIRWGASSLVLVIGLASFLASGDLALRRMFEESLAGHDRFFAYADAIEARKFAKRKQR